MSDGVIRGCLIDLDGTIYQDDDPIAGAAEAISALRHAKIPFRFATNTTRRSRRAIVEHLRSMGVDTDVEEVLTAPVVAALWLRARNATRVHLLIDDSTLEDFSGFDLVSKSPEYVVVGDLGQGWSFQALNTAFLHLVDGAQLIAIQKNRFWSSGGELRLDAGPFIAALEYASGQEAIVVGKPSKAFFEAAASSLGLEPGSIVVVGDDLESDIAGAIATGLHGIAVRTGKYRPGEETRTREMADAVIDSIADLPGWLGLAGD